MRRRALALVTAGLLLVGCGSAGSDSSPAATAAQTTSVNGSAPATEPAASAPEAANPTQPTDGEQPAAAPAALQFTAPQVGGGEIDFTRSAGRAVALWFWAPT